MCFIQKRKLYSSVFLRDDKNALLIIVEYKISRITALYLRGCPTSSRYTLQDRKCRTLGFFSYYQKIRCKLKNDTEAKATELMKKKLGFNLLTDRVMKYLVLVDFLYPATSFDDV